MVLKKILLINLVVLFSTIPYVAVFPLSSDIQYPVFLLCFLIIIWDLFENKLSLNRLEIFFLFISLISFFYVFPFSEFDYSISKRVGLLFGFAVFYVYSRYWKIINVNFFLTGVFLNSLSSVIHYLFPEFWIEISNFFIRSIVLDAASQTGSRGVSGLSAEPGFLGGMAGFFSILAYALLMESRIQKKTFIFIILNSILMVYLSKSGNAYFIFAFVLAGLIIFSDLKIYQKFLFFLLFLVIFILLVFIFDLPFRGLILFRILFTNPEYFFFIDDSIAMRISSLLVAFHSVIQGNIFGNGAGSLAYVAQEILDKANLSNLFSVWVYERSGGVWSSLGQYTTELGVIFLLFYILIFTNTNFKKLSIYLRSFSLLLSLGTFSILFPPFWIMLAVTDKRLTSSS